MKDRKNFLGHLALWGTAFIWGTSFVILKEALDSIGTMWVLALRFIIAAALLLLAAGKRLKTLGRDGLRGGVLLGVCLAAAYIFQTYGLKYTTPGKNAFLTATYCVLVPFMVWAFFKRRPNAANIIAAFMCVFGIGLVSLSGTSPFNIGDALTLVCGIFYAQMKTANEQSHANAYMPAEGLALSVVEDTYTHTTETETYDPVKDDSSSSSSGSSTDSDGFGGSSGGKF